MSRIRVRIGQLALENPGGSPADWARVGRMVEAHLERLLRAGSMPSAQNAGTIAANVALPVGKQASAADIAGSIARGIHQAILNKR